MLAIAASADGTLDPAAARAKRRPVILFQGGIHAGEIDGKDGGFWALRELLDGAMAPGALAAATAVFVPVFNVDGHERFRRNQRPNQRGPEEMGFRATAQNLNLNRDYMKAEAPEMRAMLGLLDAWDPVVQVDLHTTDGAKFQHDVAVIVEPSAPHPGGLDTVARSLSGALQARLSALGHLPLPFYPAFREDDDPSSGISTEPGPPRFSQSYSAARNRIGVLVETHSWATHAERVRAVHDLLGALFERAASDAGSLHAAVERADAASARLAGVPFALTHRAGPVPRIFPFRGFAYEKRASEISGGTWTRYDESRPEIWRVPLFDRIQPDLIATAPGAGYVVPAAHAAWLADKLRLHGVRYQVLPEARPGFAVEAFRADTATFEQPFEGRTRVKLQGAFRPERQDLSVPHRAAAGAPRPAPPRAARARLPRRLGLFQRLLRAQGVHGGLRRRGGGPRHAGGRSGAARRVRGAPARSCVREGFEGSARFLLQAPSVLGRALEPRPGIPRRRGSMTRLSSLSPASSALRITSNVREPRGPHINR